MGTYATTEVIEDDLMAHQAAVGRNWRTVACIKQALERLSYREISEGCAASICSEAWFELAEDEQRLIWRAPRNGGIAFTTQERAWLKLNLARGKA